MHPLSFMMFFLSLALLVVLGLVLTRLGTVKLRRQMRSGIGTRVAIVAVSRQSILIAAGLLCITYSIFAAYRVVWGG